MHDHSTSEQTISSPQNRNEFNVCAQLARSGVLVDLPDALCTDIMLQKCTYSDEDDLHEVHTNNNFVKSEEFLYVAPSDNRPIPVFGFKTIIYESSFVGAKKHAIVASKACH